jgi:hypothetical protein
VGHIYVVLPDDKNQALCTGVAISDDLLLTARHCLFDGDDQINIKSVYMVMDEINTYSGKKFELDMLPVDKGSGSDDDFVVLRSKTPLGDFAKYVPKIGTDPGPRQDLYIYSARVKSNRLARRGCKMGSEERLKTTR